MDLMWIPVDKSLAPQRAALRRAARASNKAETAAKFGEEQVQIWRRSYDVPPPALERNDPRYPGHDPRYADLRNEELPLTECAQGHGRAVPPVLARDDRARDQERAVACSSPPTATSLRALVKYLDNVTDEEIVDAQHPDRHTARLRAQRNDLRPIKHYYLGDPEAVKKAAEAVAKQGQKA